MPLTQKEKMLLQDLRAEEQLCAEKYSQYSGEACDAELRKLFKQIGKKEETHIELVNEMLGEKATNEKKQETPKKSCCGKKTENKKTDKKADKQHDQYLCSDCLSMEKHVSSVYNTSIFEFDDKDMRNTLNKIQKDEQNHGEQLAQYMEDHNMYC